jgi:hypothetical protein
VPGCTPQFANAPSTAYALTAPMASWSACSPHFGDNNTGAFAVTRLPTNDVTGRTEPGGYVRPVPPRDLRDTRKNREEAIRQPYFIVESQAGAAPS